MVLVYRSTKTNGQAAALISAVSRACKTVPYEVCPTLDELQEKLRTRYAEGTIAVIMAADSGELRALLDMREQLSDLKIILIIPDEGDESVKLGHSLRPRFISQSGGSYNDVGAVLERMIANAGWGNGTNGEHNYSRDGHVVN